MPNEIYLSNNQLVFNLKVILNEIKDPIIAVSGGVDSTTLSSFARKTLGRKYVRMVHAISPAVPEAATSRIRFLSDKEDWNIEYVDAGEFSDPNYRSNPLNRCFFCKSNLYKTLSKIAAGTIISGTNLDDLEDFRPGLEAASKYRVRHPYVEAKFRKSDLRILAKNLGLGSLAALPASPCLSSRVETGIKIQAADLKSIDGVEKWIMEMFTPAIVRCRLRANGVTIELDKDTVNQITKNQKHRIEAEVVNRFPQVKAIAVTIQEYQRGSSFIGKESLTSNV